MVATSGLFGSQRGTWTGALEDTAGGALIPTLPLLPRGVDIPKKFCQRLSHRKD